MFDVLPGLSQIVSLCDPRGNNLKVWEGSFTLIQDTFKFELGNQCFRVCLGVRHDDVQNSMSNKMNLRRRSTTQ